MSRLGKPWVEDPEVGPRALAPLLAQRLTADAADIDAVEGARDTVKARRVDDQVELVVALRGAYSRGRDAFDRRVLQGSTSFDVVAVVDLEVVGLQGQALDAEAVVLRDQLLGDRWVRDAPADAVRDVLGELRVGFLVREDLDEVLQPDAEARLVVEPVPQGEALFPGDVPEAAPVRLVNEAAGRDGRRSRRSRRSARGSRPSPARKSAELLSGALQLGRRWNTLSSPTLSAISLITWMPVAPVPTTPTRLPFEVHGLVRPVVGVE
jgi:hypothetical protein